MHICTECIVNHVTTTVQSEKNCSEEVEGSAFPVQPTDQQAPECGQGTMEEFFAEQSKDAYGRKITTQVGLNRPDFQIDHNGLLVRTLRIDGCLQKVVPVSRQKFIFHTQHHQQVTIHLGERRMYDTMQRECY